MTNDELDTGGKRTVQCIRCDRELEESLDLDDRGYHALTFDHEASALPICDDCFDEVKDRDLW